MNRNEVLAAMREQIGGDLIREDMLRTSKGLVWMTISDQVMLLSNVLGGGRTLGKWRDSPDSIPMLIQRWNDIDGNRKSKVSR
jgi:hypothetical protein